MARAAVAGSVPTLGGQGTGRMERKDTARPVWVPRTLIPTDVEVRRGLGRASRVSPPCCPPPPRRIVCAIQAAEVPFTGGIEVDVNGKLGLSPPHVQFTYQVSAWPPGAPPGRGWGRVAAAPTPALTGTPLPLFQEPHPLSVEPKQGPQAGGTTLTIHGTHLDTGSAEDVRVTLNGVPCKVWVPPPGGRISHLPWSPGVLLAVTLSLSWRGPCNQPNPLTLRPGGRMGTRWG